MAYDMLISEEGKQVSGHLYERAILFVNGKHSQQFSPGTKLLARKSSRKNLFVVDENEHARERDAANRQQSNEDST